METNTALVTNPTQSLLEEFTGGSDGSVEMMIGVGLVKDSDAVFFQYMGEEQQPTALMMPSGRPLTRLANVTLAGIDVADDIGEFKSTKLNLFLQSSQGRCDADLWSYHHLVSVRAQRAYGAVQQL